MIYLDEKTGRRIKGRACYAGGCPYAAIARCDAPGCVRICCRNHANEVGSNRHHCLGHTKTTEGAKTT